MDMLGVVLMDEEKLETMAEEHAEFIKQWYKAVFKHGYKHGHEEKVGGEKR